MVDWKAAILVVVLSGSTTLASAQALSTESPEAKNEAQRLDSLPPISPAPPGHIDHSGRREKGRASFYAKSFTNRKMADGKRMNPNSNMAASKNLPLGSVAKVVNLENGKSATIKIEDRGPYVQGRVVDLSPKVADELDMKRKGIAPVEVKPITVPAPDGGVKLGAGAADASPQEVHEAVQITKQLTAPATTETAAK
jgi:rare lipoprotein A